MNDELGAKIMKEFVQLAPETYSYEIDGGCGVKIKCV